MLNGMIVTRLLAVSSSIFILFLYPLVPGGIFVGERSVLALLLAAWWIGSGWLVLRRQQVGQSLAGSWRVGMFACVAMLVVMAVDGERWGDLLPISHTVAFFGVAEVLRTNQWLSDRAAQREEVAVVIAIVVAAAAGVFFAYGVILDTGTVVTGYEPGEGRFTFISDTIGMSLGVIYLANVAFRRGGLIAALCIAGICLGALRILASATQGLSLAALGGVAVIAYGQRRMRRVLHGRRSKIAFASALVLGLFGGLAAWQGGTAQRAAEVSLSYWDILKGRGADTLVLRYQEALSDFDAFMAAPILGLGNQRVSNWGLETSYGHFFVTGTLARFGLVGFLLLCGAYVMFARERWIAARAAGRTEDQLFLLAVLAWAIVVFPLGNPLYLMVGWAGTPLLLVRPTAPRDVHQ